MDSAVPFCRDESLLENEPMWGTAVLAADPAYDAYRWTEPLFLVSYGRLTTDHLPEFLTTIHEGQISLAHYRGRIGYPQIVQAAAYHNGSPFFYLVDTVSV